MFENIKNSIGDWLKLTKKTNPKFDEFEKLDKDQDEAERNSVLNKFLNDQKNNPASLNHDQVNAYVDFVYGAVSTNKPERLKSYHQMANFPEVSDAMDEICDSSITKDEDGFLVKLNLSDLKHLDDLAQKEIQRAFNEYINLFDFESNMFEFMRTFLIEGELAWENLVNNDKKEAGIIGINFLNALSYEYAIDTVKKEKVGLAVAFDQEIGEETSNNAQLFNKYGNLIQVQNLNVRDQVEEETIVVLPWPQVTYINSGIDNFNKTFVYPVLEKARKAYNQLTLIEDSIIIYRLVRAPERLVFNVDTGKLSRAKAEEEVRKMMKRYQTKKVYNPTTGTLNNNYDVHQMLESFWFVKPEGSDGTTVDTLGGSSGFSAGDLEDLYYFVRKLYKSLKVPFSRYEEPTQTYEKGDTITYEEFRFAKFIMRLLTRFAKGLSEGFKTHLQLKGLWEQHKLNKRDYQVEFTSPTAFEIYEQQRLLEVKVDRFDKLTQMFALDSVNSFVLEEYLGYNDDDIKKVWNKIRDDEIQRSKIEWTKGNVEETGEPTAPLEKDEEW